MYFSNILNHDIRYLQETLAFVVQGERKSMTSVFSFFLSMYRSKYINCNLIGTVLL